MDDAVDLEDDMMSDISEDPIQVARIVKWVELRVRPTFTHVST